MNAAHLIIVRIIVKSSSALQALRNSNLEHCQLLPPIFFSDLLDLLLEGRLGLGNVGGHCCGKFDKHNKSKLYISENCLTFSP